MPHAPDVASVTSAAPPASVDRRRRTRNYLLTMALRTLCFVLAYLADGWLRWTCVVLAVLLPYVAVVLANAVGPRRGSAMSSAGPVDRPQITR